MPKKRHSAEQIVTKLRQIDVLVAQGRTIGQACKGDPWFNLQVAGLCLMAADCTPAHRAPTRRFDGR